MLYHASLGGTKTIDLCATCHGIVHDRKKISHSALTKKALDKLRKQNKPFSRSMYGFDVTPDGKNLVENKAEQKTILKILTLRKAGYSFPKIAQELTRLKIPTKRGAKKWNQATINGLVRRWGGKENLLHVAERRLKKKSGSRKWSSGRVSERRRPKPK